MIVALLHMRDMGSSSSVEGYHLLYSGVGWIWNLLILATLGKGLFLNIWYYQCTGREGGGFKVKLSPKCNLGSFCECTRVKCSFKSIITMKVPLLRLTVFLFSGRNHFHWSARSISKIAIFKTLRKLDTTWNFARVSTHGHWHENIVCVHIVKNKVFEQLMLPVVFMLATILPVVKSWSLNTT